MKTWMKWVCAALALVGILAAAGAWLSARRKEQAQ